MITSILRRRDSAAGNGGGRTAMRKTRAGLAALAAAGVLAAAGGSVALASTGGAAAKHVPRCREGGLVTGLYGYQHDYYDGKGQGGFILTLTNKGATPCYLYGYPGLGLEDANHKVLASHTHWGPTYFAHDPGKHRIVLSPGETASADFATVYAGHGKGAGAAYLEVTPPNGYDHAVIAFPNNIGQISTNNLYVTAMARHTPWRTGLSCC